MPAWHLITGEFPPQPGGVSDYTRSVAEELAAAGEAVHVWCPPVSGPPLPMRPGVEVHRELGRLSPADLRRVGRSLDAFPAPRRLLVQWVPHSYGYRTMNLGFCLWLWSRAARGDQVQIMVHEPYLPFHASAIAQNVAALVHRLMTITLLRAADRVWVSTPAWARRWRRYALGRDIPFVWTPIPSSVPVVDDPAGVAAVRARYARAGQCLVGHFGSYRPAVSALLSEVLDPVLEASDDRVVLLLGRGGKRLREDLLRARPAFGERLHATGGLPAAELSRALSACDLMVQPFPDGVNGRQSSIAALLAHGLPTVTTAGENTESIWAATDAVALVPTGDPIAAADCVSRLLRDREERERLGRAAVELYRSRIDLRHTIDALRSASE